MTIAGWNDHVKQERDQSLLWHFKWQQSGRPNHGHIYQIMKTTLHRYHYSIRWCKNKQQNQRTKLAENIGVNFVRLILCVNKPVTITLRRFT